jgi:hypothetical protein
MAKSNSPISPSTENETALPPRGNWVRKTSFLFHKKVNLSTLIRKEFTAVKDVIANDIK